MIARKPSTAESSTKKQPSRYVRGSEEFKLWLKAGGRCVLCNRDLQENEDFGIESNVAQMAHIVGHKDSESSPRGKSELPLEDRQLEQNLLLVCVNCHQPIDKGGYKGKFTVERLIGLKRDHEERVRRSLEIGGDRLTYVLRMVSFVRDAPPEISRETVFESLLQENLFPKKLPGSFWEEAEIDLKPIKYLKGKTEFSSCVIPIKQKIDLIQNGIAQGEIRSLAIFAFARIPVLIELGARLDDKFEPHIFQYRRNSPGLPWILPPREGTSFGFDVVTHQESSDLSKVCLIISLSGKVQVDELPTSIRASHTIYEVTPSPPTPLGPDLVHSGDFNREFEVFLRGFLAWIEDQHKKKAKTISLFPAVGLTTGLQLGRVLMPHISPSWTIYDRDEKGRFFKALTVKR